MVRRTLTRKLWLRLVVGLLAASLLGVLVVLALQPRVGEQSQVPGIVPGLSEDLQTLVGRPAPTFTLPDDRGVARTVRPGSGKPLVLILHMGLF